jgi:hypothetical protein
MPRPSHRRRKRGGSLPAPRHRRPRRPAARSGCRWRGRAAAARGRRKCASRRTRRALDERRACERSGRYCTFHCDTARAADQLRTRTRRTPQDETTDRRWITPWQDLPDMAPSLHLHVHAIVQMPLHVRHDLETMPHVVRQRHREARAPSIHAVQPTAPPPVTRPPIPGTTRRTTAARGSDATRKRGSRRR